MSQKVTKISISTAGTSSQAIPIGANAEDITVGVGTSTLDLQTQINNLESSLDTNTSAIGTLSNLTTTAKTNLVAAINEIDSDVGTNTFAIGTLSNLTTTAKTNLVSAVNEINGKFVPSEGGTFTGNILIKKSHTDTSTTQSLLQLGNNISNGTAGASHGVLRVYGYNDKYIDLRCNTDNLSDNRSVYLPDAGGTIALTSQLTNGSVTKIGTSTVGSSNKGFYLNAGVPTVGNEFVPKSGGTFTGDIVINEPSTTTSSEVSMLTLGNSTATGTEGNSNGMVRMYGQGDKHVSLRPVTTSGTYTSANRTIYLPDADGTLALQVAPTVVTGTLQTTNIPNATSTVVEKMTLTAGTWVVVGGCQFVNDFSALTVLTFDGSNWNPVVRANGNGGGGMNIASIEIVSSTATINMSVYQASGSTQAINRVLLRAVKVGY